MQTIQKAALAIALVAAPGIANAGTSTATGSANFNVVNQCSISGATVNLGTYTANNTVADVGADLGQYGEDDQFRIGNRGTDYATWGSVTCDAGTPYTLTILGSNPDSYGFGTIQFKWKNAAAQDNALMLHVLVKKIGNNVVPDSFAPWAGGGAIVNLAHLLGPAAGVGTGSPQEIRGSAIYDWSSSLGPSSEPLVPGTYTDTLTYTLNF